MGIKGGCIGIENRLVWSCAMSGGGHVRPWHACAVVTFEEFKSLCRGCMVFYATRWM
jgi:hypothetical protein